MTYSEAKQVIADKGFTVSVGSYETESRIYVFSMEVVKGTYGHPSMVVDVNKKTGHVDVY